MPRMSEPPLTLSVLVKFHREMIAPDFRRVFERLDRMDARFDEINGRFDDRNAWRS